MSLTLEDLGRDPTVTLANNPATDPRCLALMQKFNLHVNQGPTAPEVARRGSDLTPFAQGAHDGFMGLLGACVTDLPEIKGIDHKEVTITGVDQNEIKLYISAPSDLTAPVPCVVHVHGGGMAILDPAGGNFVRWRDQLSSRGLVVVGVDFRNSALAAAPFPAGLNDCVSAINWVHENKSNLNVSNIIVSGESGGGNLSIATALKLKQDGNIDQISGVYAQCPYVSNLWHDKTSEEAKQLPSLNENNGFYIHTDILALLAYTYDLGDQKTMRNPLAWPFWATVEDLKGLPPVIVTVNELDPMRDEGLALARKLRKAGVSGSSQVLLGITHAFETMCEQFAPDITAAAIDAIAAFSRATA